MISCPLCKLESLTKTYYEDEYWKIVDCLSCKSPIAIYKFHKDFVELDHLIFILERIEELFGIDFLIRTKQRKIKNHFHFHIIKK